MTNAFWSIIVDLVDVDVVDVDLDVGFVDIDVVDVDLDVDFDSCNYVHSHERSSDLAFVRSFPLMKTLAIVLFIAHYRVTLVVLTKLVMWNAAC